MSSPTWELEPSTPDWYLDPGVRQWPVIKSSRAMIYRAVSSSPALIERSAVAEEAPILSVKFALFNRWVEVDSAVEGHFMERVAPGAFKKSIRENLSNIKAILSHGKDPSLGQTVLGTIEAINEEDDGATARVALFRSVPALFLDGLRAGVYGASFRAKTIKNAIDYTPGRSQHNPDGIPEVTRTELRLVDVGPTPFPQYDGTSSVIGGA